MLKRHYSFTYSTFKNVHIPDQYKRLLKQSQPIETNRLKVLKPLKVIQTLKKDEQPMTVNAIRRLSRVQKELTDLIDYGNLPKQLQNSIDIVSLDTTNSSEVVIVWWRKYPQCTVPDKDLAFLLHGYSSLFRKIIGSRLSRGVNQRWVPKLIFKQDFSHDTMEKARKILNVLEKNQ